MLKINLKFQLVKFEKALAFQVIEQTKDWLCKNSDNDKQVLVFESKKYKFFTTNKTIAGTEFKSKEKVPVKIISARQSNITVEYGLCIRLWGDKESYYNDYKMPIVSSINFENNKQRDDFYILIIKVLKEWSAHVYKETKREPQEFKELGNGIFII